MNQRLNQQSAQQLDTTAEVRTQRQTFEEAEEVIRADREQTQVPAALSAKLAGTIADEPKPGRDQPWWKRLFR